MRWTWATRPWREPGDACVDRTPAGSRSALSADRRVDALRIGSAPNDGGNIVTSWRCRTIVHDVLVTEIGKNGHAVVTGDKDVVLAPEVDEFGLDIVTGYPESPRRGPVSLIALAVVYGRTGERVLVRRYVGIRYGNRCNCMARTPGVRCMETALARTMHDLATTACWLLQCIRVWRNRSHKTVSIPATIRPGGDLP